MHAVQVIGVAAVKRADALSSLELIQANGTLAGNLSERVYELPALHERLALDPSRSQTLIKLDDAQRRKVREDLGVQLVHK